MRTHLLSSFARHERREAPAGFTLIELMITLVIIGFIMIVLFSVIFGSSRSRTSTMNGIESTQSARAALSMIARDLRSAGYGSDRNWTALPQPPIAYIDSMQVLINGDFKPYPDTSPVLGWPLAYNPTAALRPFPLNGTAWQPPLRYRTGAEVIRWTLDTNNDGVVNANDIAAADGVDAAATRNPNDYELVRQTWGDSTNAAAGNNGGTSERMALVRKPGGSVPPMFTVYFTGSTTPWNWANGPVPANNLSKIRMIQVQIVAPSSKPDASGQYASTQMQTQAWVLRNIPDFGDTLYAVDGYVYKDTNKNHFRDAGEPGIPNAAVTLGTTRVTYTDANGYFLFSVIHGNYVLRHHNAPTGYGIFNSPDSTAVTVGPATNYSFGDTALAGGFIAVTTFFDANSNGIKDPGEPWIGALKITGSPGPDVEYTDGLGSTTVFVPVGAYTVTCSPPDSLVSTTSNPVSGVMTNGGSASCSFGLSPAPTGIITGTVYLDTNRNGVLDAGEDPLQNVFVGISKDAGLTYSGSGSTNSSGVYSITVPANSPPTTTPYTAIASVPAGYYPTSSTTSVPIWVTASSTTSSINFGMSGFQIISLNGSRVLCLGSGDLIESDWLPASTANRRKDADLVLGADGAGSNQVNVWFNQYTNTPLFNADPDYSRPALASVMSLSVDTLDAGAGTLQNLRNDVVTGTAWTASGNLFTWLNQNTSGNEGYLPTAYTTAYKTTDKGDVQAVVTGDVYGASAAADGVDIIAGTKSPTAGQGTFEIWSNKNSSPAAFQQQEIYPPKGNIPGNVLGEVNALALVDLDGDGLKDLVVGTTTSTGLFSGQLMVFQNKNKITTPRFQEKNVYTLAADRVTALAVLDVDGDGRQDIVAGTQSGAGTGNLLWYRNTGNLNFTLSEAVIAPGIVTALGAGDLGGLGRKDLVVGWRHSTSDYAGGVAIYITDAGILPLVGSDPSAGAITNFVPAVTLNNFNYGVFPSTPSPPFLMDIAAGVKQSATTGSIVVLIR